MGSSVFGSNDKLSKCLKCGQSSWGEEKLYFSKLKLFSEVGARVDVKLYATYCNTQGCDGHKLPDGQVDGVFLQSKTEGYCHQYLSTVMDRSSNHGHTLDSQYITLVNVLDRLELTKEAPGRSNWFRAAPIVS